MNCFTTAELYISFLCCYLADWGPWYSWLGLPSWPLRQPVSVGCTRWPCGRRLWLVTKAH